MRINVLGIDLAKSSFQLHGVDERGKPVLRKKLNRAKFIEFMRSLAPCIVAMAYCGSANYWARLFRMGGHEIMADLSAARKAVCKVPEK